MIRNLFTNFIPSFVPQVAGVGGTGNIYMDIRIDNLDSDKKGVEKFFSIIGNEMKRKGLK
jgi:hypothetical protein